MAINLKHRESGLLKKAPTGFSFTTLFFGIFVHMFRGHWGPAFITWFTFGFANLFYCFAGNKRYVRHLLENGYGPASEEDTKKLQDMSLLSVGQASKAKSKEEVAA